MIPSNWIWLGAAASAIAMGWQYIRGFSRMAGSGMIASVRYAVGDRAIHLLSDELAANWHRVYQTNRTMTTLVNERGWLGTEYAVAEEVGIRNLAVGDWVLYRKGLRFLFVRKVNVRNEGGHGLEFVWIRGTLDFDRWVLQATEEFSKPPVVMSQMFMQNAQRNGWDSKIVISDSYTYDPSHFGSTMRFIGCIRRTIDLEFNEAKPATAHQLYLGENAKRFIAFAKDWAANQLWYYRRGLEHKTGAFLYGPPGTGKTALVRWLANDINASLYCFNRLRFTTDDEFRSLWRELVNNKATRLKIALFDDFDEVFHLRENVGLRPLDDQLELMMSSLREETAEANGSGGPPGGQPVAHRSAKNRSMVGGRYPLAFQTILESLGGVELIDGVLVVVTANHPERVDPALGGPDPHNGICSTRPGRIDFSIHMDYLCEDGRRVLADRMFDGEGVEEWINVNRHREKVTPAQWILLCTEEAMRRRRQPSSSANGATVVELPPDHHTTDLRPDMVMPMAEFQSMRVSARCAEPRVADSGSADIYAVSVEEMPGRFVHEGSSR